MNRQTQQQHFGARLRQVLRERGLPVHSPTNLMREFNKRSPAPRITAHAARKWLMGESIPTQEKLLVLSAWLGVAPQWLRYDGDEPANPEGGPLLSPRAAAIAVEFDNLTEEHRYLVESFLHMLKQVPSRQARRASEPTRVSKTGTKDR